MTITPLEFIDLQRRFYEAWYVPNLKQGINQVDLDLNFFEMLANQVQNEIAELKEEHVKMLRSIPYKKYLLSAHWQGVRKMMLAHAGYRCQLCNDSERILHVHHRSYENRGRETHSDLIVLCEDCHSQFHDKLELSK